METALPDVDPHVLQAVVQNAERQALMVAAYLKHVDPQLKRDGFPSGADGLPAGYLLELGATLMLGQWDLQGLRTFLPSELPAFADATRILKHRAASATREFSNVDSAHLSRQIGQIWLERFAWEAPNLLQADVVLGDVDADALIEAVAQLVWANRHIFSK